MKTLLLLISLVFSSVNCDVRLELKYELPDGLKIINTFERNGVLTLIDQNGNGANLYLENSGLHSVKNPFEDYGLQKIEETKFDDGSYSAKFNNTDPVDSFDKAFFFDGNNGQVYAFLFLDGAPKTHGVFEEQIMQIAREIAQGGKDGYAWKNCVGNFFGSRVHGGVSSS